MLGPLMALALGVGPGFMEPVPLRLVATEDSDEQALLDVCRLPGAQLELQTRSNMIATGTLEALRRCHRPVVELRLPLLRAHLDELAKIPSAEPLFDLAPGQSIDWTQASLLGPRRLHIRVHGPLTDQRAADLARLRNATVELDLRGRVPNAHELALFRDLARLDRTVRLDASIPPPVLAALRHLELARVVIVTRNGVLPVALLDALVSHPIPTRIALDWPFAAVQVAPLGAVRQVSLEVSLGTLESRPLHLMQALSPLEPDFSKPLRGAAPGPGLPAR